MAYARSLSVSNGEGYTLVSLVKDIMNVAKTNMSSNAIVIPVLQTVTILLEADVLRTVVDCSDGKERQGPECQYIERWCLSSA